MNKNLKLFFELVQRNFPEGFQGDHFIPVEIAACLFRVVIFKPEQNTISFGLFLNEQKTARRIVTVYRQGTVVSQTPKIPTDDLTDKEPKLGKVKDRKIAEDVVCKFEELMAKSAVHSQ